MPAPDNAVNSGLRRKTITNTAVTGGVIGGKRKREVDEDGENGRRENGAKLKMMFYKQQFVTMVMEKVIKLIEMPIINTKKSFPTILYRPDEYPLSPHPTIVPSLTTDNIS